MITFEAFDYDFVYTPINLKSFCVQFLCLLSSHGAPRSCWALINYLFFLCLREHQKPIKLLFFQFDFECFNPVFVQLILSSN